MTAQFFRVKFQPVPAAPPPFDLSELGIPKSPPPTDYKIAELVLHPGARVNLFEEKDGFSTAIDLYSEATPEGAPGGAIAKDDIIDLT